MLFCHVSASGSKAAFLYIAEPFRWSEDFGYYLQRTRGAFIGVGCGRDHAGLHTMEYEFEDGIIGTAIDLYKELV